MNTTNFRKILDTAALRIRDAEIGTSYPSDELILSLLTFDPRTAADYHVTDLYCALRARSESTYHPAVDVNEALDALETLDALHQVFVNLSVIFHDI